MDIIIKQEVDDWELKHRDKDEQCYPFTIRVYVMDAEALDKFLADNEDKTRDRTGYRPALMVHPDVDTWLRENIGPGQRGSALPGEKDYKVHLVGQKWWHSWSYAYEPYHTFYVDFHFRYEEDAATFKLGLL